MLIQILICALVLRYTKELATRLASVLNTLYII